ncbi:serine/arginine repetitive matrix protein 1-like [Gymnogyps californianus]|uniref:serine/arginine repetitive matrix protein 1-like n=1 Tax=Gymnogyps californianus TaxID=33616 RepID=UPI0021C6C8EF|nr:serine/arginine repetitive matrix protein 1-like [Gymnogyps californianus]
MCHTCGGCEEKSCQEKAASFEGEEAAGKGRLRTQGHQKNPRCSPAASPGSTLRPGFPRRPGSAPRSCPGPRGAAPSRHRAAEIPHSPARRRRAALPAAAPDPKGSPSSPSALWRGAPPRPSSHHLPPLPPRPRLHLTPPRRPTHTQAKGPLRPPRAGPAPRGRETMSSHNSPAAPELRGSGGGSSPPSPSPPPPPRSGIRPPGAEPPLLPSLPREPPPPPGRRPRSLPEESHFIPRSNMAAPPAAAAAAAFALPRLPAAAEERPQAVLGSRPAGRWRCRERPGWPRVSRAGPRGVRREGGSRAGLRVSAAD